MPRLNCALSEIIVEANLKSYEKWRRFIFLLSLFSFFIAKSTFLPCGFLHLMSCIFPRERTILIWAYEGLFWNLTCFGNNIILNWESWWILFQTPISEAVIMPGSVLSNRTTSSVCYTTLCLLRALKQSIAQSRFLRLCAVLSNVWSNCLMTIRTHLEGFSNF